jgi:predicted transglutaminase-like cysteine proteinase
MLTRPLAMALVVAVACGLGDGAAKAQPPLAAGLMGSLQVSTNSSWEIKRWRFFSRKYDREKAVYAMCDGEGSLCSPKLRRWRQVLESLKGASIFDQIDEVNRTVNALVTYRADAATGGGIGDHWSSPLQTLEQGGDCEDIVMLKYISLMELGVPEKKLRLVVVRERKSGLGHAVLAVQASKKLTLVLDNRTAAVLPDDRVRHYQPLYSISGKKRWLHLGHQKIQVSSVE